PQRGRHRAGLGLHRDQQRRGPGEQRRDLRVVRQQLRGGQRREHLRRDHGGAPAVALAYRAIAAVAHKCYRSPLRPQGLPAAVIYAVGSTPLFAAVADFNGDDRQDLAVANSATNNVSILLGNGDGTFQAATNYGVGAVPFAVTVEDFNGDGTPDLAVANNGSN